MKRVVTALAMACLLGLPAQAAIPRRAAASTSSSVIAIIEGGGVNVLHHDFRLGARQRLRLPPGMPQPRWVSLPAAGTFAERLAAAEKGPLGNLEGGQLYWIRGSRLGVFVPKGSTVTSVLEDRGHATGSVSAAIGLEHGTNRDGLAIILPDKSPAAWEWLVDQRWIDFVSTSYYTGFDSGAGSHATCPEHHYIRRIAKSGRVVFTSSGNVEQAGVAHTPSGSPYSYQVGGVDADGRTYLPGAGGDEASVTPTRPYETGDRFDFSAADSESLTGSMDFGGTSGATPSTAGRAGDVLEFARDLLRSPRTGVRNGLLAVAAPDVKVPRKGPLADRRLERHELVRVLHHVAIPAAPESPGRYIIEGYGALNNDAIKDAKRVLAGALTEPVRQQEDEMHQALDPARSLLFPAARCG